MEKHEDFAEEIMRGVDFAIQETVRELKEEGYSNDYCDGYERGATTIFKCYMKAKGFDISQNA